VRRNQKLCCGTRIPKPRYSNGNGIYLKYIRFAVSVKTMRTHAHKRALLTK